MDQFMDRLVEHYDSVAGSYEENLHRVNYFSPEWIAAHAHELQSLPECRVLDLGCGTGVNVKVLCEHRTGVRADGVDVSPKMIEQARSTKRYERLYTHDLNTALSEIDSETYDAVIAFGFLELLSGVDVCLSECHRVLKANGTLWASVRRFEAEDEGSPPRHQFIRGMTIRGYSAAEILQMMKNLHMRVIALDSVVGYITRAGFVYPQYVLRAQRMQ